MYRRWIASDPSARIDGSLTLLLCVQALTLFVAIPLSAAHPQMRFLMDLCHFAFAAICVGVLARSTRVRAALIAMLTILLLAPALADRQRALPGLPHAEMGLLIASAAFAFNALVTALVAQHVFSGGRVTLHRIRGAVLLYLNVAALFAIAFGALAGWQHGMFAGSARLDAQPPGARTVLLTYFSLTTITTTGFGDVVPVHPLARSLAMAEAVFGQLFPATLLARLVGLHLAHENRAEPPRRRPRPPGTRSG